DRVRRADRAARHAAPVGPPPPLAAPRVVPRRGRAARARRHDRARRGRTARAARRHRDRARRRSPLRRDAPTMDRELILDVRGVAYRYRGTAHDALAGVSLAARAGDFLAVIGPNGSGKTTLVRVALGLVAPHAGTAQVLGRPPAAWSRRALAQEPRLLVLDEPTAGLDLRHEMDLFELARGLADGRGLAVIMITHHVNLAARFADRVLLLADGRPVADGPPGDVLTRETVERVFAWPVAIEAFDGRPQMIPLRKGREP